MGDMRLYQRPRMVRAAGVAPARAALLASGACATGGPGTAQRAPQSQLRPKIRTTVQFPLPVADSLEMLYGVGLVVPEALLIAGCVVWLRQRAA